MSDVFGRIGERVREARSEGAAAERQRVIEWLCRSDDDWPWTGRDIASLIAAGMPEWDAPSPSQDTP